MLINVHTKSEYSVYIGLDEWRLSPKFDEERRVFVIADRHLENAEKVTPIYVEGGEGCKNMETYVKLLCELSARGATRDDIVYVVGGGTVLDLGAFVCSTYMRGIDYVLVPTSLLAMVDASIGGKNGVNLGYLKNQVGTIRQPKAVVIETAFLKTLSKDEFINGCGEVVKYAMIDENLAKMLLTKGIYEAREKGDYDYITEVISKCVEIKARLVEEDELDRGKRRILNFGHTFAHAIEAKSDYRIQHGKAVAMGMIMATEKAIRLGFCDETVLKKLDDLLLAHKLVSDSPYDEEELIEYMEHDKKAKHGLIEYVLPTDRGFKIITQ